jgi:hypothetical protein
VREWLTRHRFSVLDLAAIFAISTVIEVVEDRLGGWAVVLVLLAVGVVWAAVWFTVGFVDAVRDRPRGRRP